MCSFRYDGDADLLHRVIDGAVADIACSLSGRPSPAYRWRGRSTAGPSHFAAWEQPKLVGEDGRLQGAGPSTDKIPRQINPTMPRLHLWTKWYQLRGRDEDLHEKSNQHILVGYARVQGVKRAYSNPRVMLRSRHRSLAAPARRELPVLSVAALAHSLRESICFGRGPNRE